MIREAMLWDAADDDRVECGLCAHRCTLAPDAFGVCGVRQNRDGRLDTHVYGEVIAAHVDPIEKKPLFHYLPGSLSFSMATAGCNFRCPFCQNWQISQLDARKGSMEGQALTPGQIVSAALARNCRSIAYTYTEPTIYFEYAYDTARLAHEAGLGNVFVTNGYMTADALETIQPYLNAANVDLKSFSDDFYRDMCKARLQPVLDSIRHMRDLEIWVEVTTLVVPGRNDSSEELRGLAEFIADVDPDIPWHISRYHPDYKYDASPPTPVETLRRAARIGREAGLHHIYVGNVPGEEESTRCQNCGALVIERQGFSVTADRLGRGACPECGTTVAGVFGD
jgi:pyruvate formate lyase activating enzyme